jgi:uncharacterized protein (TIGR00251 family)
MSLPPYLLPQAGVVCLCVKLQPRAARNQIGDALGPELKIKVTAPPVDSAANEALVRLLADVLDCPRGTVQMARGHTSRHKRVLVRGLSAEEIAARLARAARA